jgi:hypothetical protein
VQFLGRPRATAGIDGGGEEEGGLDVAGVKSDDDDDDAWAVSGEGRDISLVGEGNEECVIGWRHPG